MTPTRIEDVRRRFGSVGALVGIGEDAPPINVQTNAVRRLEASGWTSLWTNETVGTDALVRTSIWLSSSRLAVGTAIANMWARPSATAHAAALELGQAYPDRFILGLGVGRPEQAAAVGLEYGSPAATASNYLGGISGGDYLRLLAANGPRMLDVAALKADGAMPMGGTPEKTRAAREAIGSSKLLVVILLNPLSKSANDVLSDVREHREAGADHVVLGPSYDTPFSDAVDYLEELAATF